MQAIPRIVREREVNHPPFAIQQRAGEGEAGRVENGFWREGVGEESKDEKARKYETGVTDPTCAPQTPKHLRDDRGAGARST